MTQTSKWLWLVGAVLLGGVLYLLAPVLSPFMIAALLAYIGDPFVDRLEAWHLPRTLAVVIVFVVLSVVALILLIILLPLLERQAVVLVNKLPGLIDWVQQTALPWLTQHFGVKKSAFDLSTLKASIREYWQAAGGMAAQVLASVSSSGLALVAWLVDLVLIPVVTFYLLRDWDVMVARIRELLPRRLEPVMVRLARESDEVLGAFLRGQIAVMAGLAAIYTLGLWFVGLELALLIGFMAGLVSFVPYLGFIVGILAASVAAVMQFHDMTHLIYVFIVFGIGQLAESMVLTPWLVGDRIGLHPVAVIFAVLAGGQLFGFFGVLLALPSAAVFMVLVRYAHERYRASRLYGA